MGRLLMRYADTLRPLVPEVRLLLPTQRYIRYPVIPALVEHGEQKRNWDLVVDSGSDYCYFRSEMGDTLFGKGKWQTGSPRKFPRHGISGVRILAFFHDLSITLIDAEFRRRTIKVPVGICQTTYEEIDGTRTVVADFAHGHAGLLGQVGFFSEFKEVTSNYNAGTITLVW
ncbi:MAG TPA: hypothetical protein VMH22_04075 [bacterium]|nr:hypothetical protein [bacterium]